MVAADDSDEVARRYHRQQFALSLADLVIGTVALAAWTWTGAAIRLAAWLGSTVATPVLVVLGMAVAVGGVSAALTFPLNLVGSFLLPRRAGLLTQSFRGWLTDRAKAVLIGGGLALAVVEVVYALIRWSPGRWWLWAAAALIAGSVLVAAIVPVWLVPLFYRLTPLEDPALRSRVLAVASRVGVRATAIDVADFSRKGRTANAAVVGLGRTRKILVSDTLLREFPPEEVEVVLAHELAHHARGHLAQGLVLQSLGIVGGLWLAARALARWGPALGLSGPADPAGLPFLALLASTLGLIATPLLAAWSRRLEREADRVALDITRAPDAFVAAMERLGRLNLAERQPGRLRELLFATHPSLAERIATGRAAAARSAPSRPFPAT